MVPRHLRVFISSPGDVAAERQLAQETVWNLHRSQAWSGKFTFETLRSDDEEAPFVMDAHLPPQVAFNRDGKKASECDLVVVILWSRMGTPLGTPQRPDGTFYQSGTEYEFEDALSNPKTRILLYRRVDEPMVPLRAIDVDERRRQLERVDAFFRRFQSIDGTLLGGYKSYRGVDEFAKTLKQDLEGVLRELEREGTVAITQTGSAKVDGPGHYFSIQRALIRTHTSRFIARPVADTAVKKFLETCHRGYFIIEAHPGEGKTALASHFVNAHGWPHHFINLSGGRADVRLILCSLLEQLSAVTGVPVDFQRPLPELAKRFDELLAKAVHPNGRIVVLLDGLDELTNEASD